MPAKVAGGYLVKLSTSAEGRSCLRSTTALVKVSATGPNAYRTCCSQVRVSLAGMHWTGGLVVSL